MWPALRAVLPRACPGCARPLGLEAGVCRACLAGLSAGVGHHSVLQRHAGPHLVSLGRHDRLVRRLVLALKYHGSQELASALGALLAPAVPCEWELQGICPVPLHAQRERERGYNQAELLARDLAVRTGVPLVPALRRVRRTARQAKLHHSRRADNVAGAFEARWPVPARVLLVDDVLTTGHTLREAAHVLRAAGAQHVFFAVVAQ